MAHEMQAPEGLEPEEDIEGHLLKESLGAGLAAAAVFAGTSQAASYPGPPAPGTADAAAEIALIPKGERAVQQTKPQAQKSKAAKKAVKAKKAKKARRAGGGRHQPQ